MLPQEVRKVSFVSEGITLEGLLCGGAEGAGRGAVICHPHPLYGGNMKNYVVAAVARELARRGVPALRFNFRGAGRSEGVHDEGRGEVDDVVGAARFLASETGVGTIDVVGYSFGARVGMAAAGRINGIGKIVAIAPPVSFMEMEGAGNIAVPKLIFRGTMDDYCLDGDFARWWAALPEPKEVVTLDGADHFFGGFEETIASGTARFLAEESSLG